MPKPSHFSTSCLDVLPDTFAGLFGAGKTTLRVDPMTSDASHSFVHVGRKVRCIPVPFGTSTEWHPTHRGLVVTSSIPSRLPICQARSAEFDLYFLSPFWPQSKAVRCGSRLPIPGGIFDHPAKDHRFFTLARVAVTASAG